MKKQIDSLYLAWAGLLDIGFEMALANLKKRKTHEEALEELKGALRRQAEEHWKSLYRAFKKMSLQESKKR